MDYEKLRDGYLNAVIEGMRKVNEDERAAYASKHASDRETIRVRPSAASVIIPVSAEYTELVGSCMRESWFNFFNVAKSNPPGPKGLRRMDMGKVIEKREHEYANSTSLVKVIDHNIRLKVPLIGDVVISAELDSLLQDVSGDIFILEIKSFYGYHARKEVFGTKTQLPRPKGQHLLQTFIYMYMLAVSNINSKYAIIHYISREDMEEKAFVIELVNEGDDAYPVVDGRPFKDYSLSKIITRYVALSNYLKAKAIPPRDCEIMYSDNKIRTFYDLGKIPKGKYQEWQKGISTPGEYQCSYCDWQGLCYGSRPEDSTTWPTDEELAKCVLGGTVASGWE